jgi:hypothetical protein
LDGTSSGRQEQKVGYEKNKDEEGRQILVEVMMLFFSYLTLQQRDDGICTSGHRLLRRGETVVCPCAAIGRFDLHTDGYMVQKDMNLTLILEMVKGETVLPSI